MLRYASFSRFEILKDKSVLILDLTAGVKQRAMGHGVLALFQREKKKKKRRIKMVNRDGQQRCC